jgi:hypothetical protein
MLNLLTPVSLSLYLCPSCREIQQLSSGLGSLGGLGRPRQLPTQPAPPPYRYYHQPEGPPSSSGGGDSSNLPPRTIYSGCGYSSQVQVVPTLMAPISLLLYILLIINLQIIFYFLVGNILFEAHELLCDNYLRRKMVQQIWFLKELYSQRTRTSLLFFHASNKKETFR